LELDPTKDDDPVRQYLAGQGLHFKTAKSVLDNFCRYYNAPLPERTSHGFSRPTSHAFPRPSVESVIAGFERVSSGRKTYAIPRVDLDSTVRHAKRRRREDKRKSWRTRKDRKKRPLKNAQEEN
jgi:hypothetical protein